MGPDVVACVVDVGVGLFEDEVPVLLGISRIGTECYLGLERPRMKQTGQPTETTSAAAIGKPWWYLFPKWMGRAETVAKWRLW